MVNVLIIEDNIHYAIFMMNYLCQHNPDIRICNIISDGKEAINVLNRQKNIDIVLLDLNLPNYNGGEILEKIVNKEKYTDSIIVLSGEIDCLKKLYKNNLISEVYPIIAKQNNDTVHNIKSNIIRANDKMYKQCEISKLLNYFNFCEDRKPDIRTVVRTIISKIT